MDISPANHRNNAHSILSITGHAYLRPLQVADITSSYIEGINDVEVGKFLSTVNETGETYGSLAKYVMDNINSSDAILFGFFLNEKLRGTCRLHDIAKDNAFIGIAIFDREIWGQGWGNKVIVTVTHFAFSELGVKRIRAGVDKRNVASARAFAKAGYNICKGDTLSSEDPNETIWSCDVTTVLIEPR